MGDIFSCGRYNFDAFVYTENKNSGLHNKQKSFTHSLFPYILSTIIKHNKMMPLLLLVWKMEILLYVSLLQSKCALGVNERRDFWTLYWRFCRLLTCPPAPAFSSLFGLGRICDFSQLADNEHL